MVAPRERSADGRHPANPGRVSSSPSPSPVGKRVTVTVRAADPIRVEVPGVGTITGPAGAVTGDGSIGVQPIAGQSTLPAGMRVTGNGVDVTFTGSKGPSAPAARTDGSPLVTWAPGCSPSR